jgi:hypothetical protein
MTKFEKFKKLVLNSQDDNKILALLLHMQENSTIQSNVGHVVNIFLNNCIEVKKSKNSKITSTTILKVSTVVQNEKVLSYTDTIKNIIETNQTVDTNFSKVSDSLYSLKRVVERKKEGITLASELEALKILEEEVEETKKMSLASAFDCLNFEIITSKEKFLIIEEDLNDVGNLILFQVLLGTFFKTFLAEPMGELAEEIKK